MQALTLQRSQGVLPIFHSIVGIVSSGPLTLRNFNSLDADDSTLQFISFSCPVKWHGNGMTGVVAIVWQRKPGPAGPPGLAALPGGQTASRLLPVGGCPDPGTSTLTCIHASVHADPHGGRFNAA